MNNGKGTAPLSDQDFQNTIDRINELQKESQNYPTPISGSNPNDPTRNELNVLYQRMTDAGYEPVMHTMGGGGGSFMDAMGKAAGINPPQQGPGTPPGGQPRKFDPHDPGFLKSLLGPTYKSGKNDWYNQQQGGVGGDFGNALNAAGAIGSMVGGGAGSGLGAGFGDTMSKIAGGAGNYFNKDNGATR
jgi:hypothetical protein